MRIANRRPAAILARCVAGLLLLTAATADAALRVDVLVFGQPAASSEGLGWTTTSPLPPCHAVQLRDGSGAEAAFANDSECQPVAGKEPMYAGYAGAGAASLTNAATKLKNGGHPLLVNRGWRQSPDLSPVLLRGGADIAGRPEVMGTFTLGVQEKYVEVTLDLVLTRLNKTSGQPEFLVIRETRKMKTGEPHYLDHPLLGAIVQVVDTEQEEKKAAR
ncbi:MAG: CsiV family protein [Gammaproteobacteria bacterium]